MWSQEQVTRRKEGHFITLCNNFHNTSCKTVWSQEELDALEERVTFGVATPADKKFAIKIWKKLCGKHGCCVDYFGRKDW